MKISRILEQVFHRKITVIYDCSPDEANIYLKKIKARGIMETDKPMEYYGALFEDKFGVSNILYIKDIKNIPALVHEVFHLVVRICNDHGVPIKITDDFDTDETAAYLIEFYMRNILKYAK